MSHIYIYSPSSAVRDKASFKRGVTRLRALGHEVRDVHAPDGARVELVF